MAEENQIVPLAPPSIHPRSDEEYAPIKRQAVRSEKSSKFLVYLLVLIVSLGAIMLVFATIFLRARTPGLELSSVMVKNLKHGNASSPSFNATLVTELRIRNPNFRSFKFRNSTGNVLYGTVTVGDMKISEGRVGGRDTKTMNVTVDVRSNGYLNTTNLSSDINSGMLNLSSYVQLHGRVNLFDITEKKKSPKMNCSMTLNLTSHAVQDLVCN